MSGWMGVGGWVWVGGWMMGGDGWMDGWVGGWVGGWVDRRMDGKKLLKDKRILVVEAVSAVTAKTGMAVLQQN